MKPTRMVIVLLVISGAIFNIMVAWMLAAVGAHETRVQERLYGMEALWPCEPQHEWPQRPDVLVNMNSPGIDIQEAAAGKFYQHRAMFGLPLRSLQTRVVSGNGDSRRAREWREGLEVPPRIRPHDHLRRRFPLLPMWPGFVINTLLYGAGIWMLFAVPHVLRRRWRLRRGLCPRCTYPIGVSDRCSECGGIVQSDRRKL